MKKTLTILFLAFFTTPTLMANDHQYISTNKSHYVVGEQVLFDVSRFDDTGRIVESDQEFIVAMDLVAPSGRIVQTKSFIKTEKGCYFFSVADSLETGVYRLVANSEGADQSIKRIHIYALELEEVLARKVTKIEHKVHGGVLVRDMTNKVAVRVTDRNGSGVKTKGTLINSVDSLVQYLDTDQNGVTSFAFEAKDSLYQIRFGNQTIKLLPQQQTMHCQLIDQTDRLELRIVNPSTSSEAINITFDGQQVSLISLDAQQDSIFQISREGMTSGLHTLEVGGTSDVKRNYTILARPNISFNLGLESMSIGNNEQSEFAIEDSADEIDQLSISVIDKANSNKVDFYEEYYFDQSALDLQLVENRDFEAYLLLFNDQIGSRVNNVRLQAASTGGILKYRSEYPFDEVSMLNLSTLKVLDMRSENIHGIYDFESAVGKESQVFPYHFTTYLQPIQIANFNEQVTYTYPPLKSSIILGKKEVDLVKSFDIQKNILLSYKSVENEKNKLPKPDYTYNLEDYDVPNTMVDMINYIVKFVSVINNKDGEPELSMYRYMSTYKYRGSPLIFLNDLPVYDARTVLNLNPKDFVRIEVRNSYQANGHLGNFSLNGSVSFYLKDGIDNPLVEAYANLPVIESCQSFSKRSSENEFAPDFKHQLYWNPKLVKTKDSFWVDLKSSDLSTTYQVEVTAFMKNGTVLLTQSELVVE